MPHWVSWPADLLLSIGSIIASWFASQAEASFSGIQTMVALLVLAAVIGAIVYGQSVAELFRLALHASRQRRNPPPSR